ncbi:hypothetical protein [Aquamicrobium sp.]|uniref:hypothetical protein n=1 Tax=Aquamicrobium sp. TaxID=1872579 RepID=UPI00258D4377|nr:hypothetical protein [Aquamicrobium sp.]MCK9549280.1 hypothetical protein [Aquamicrobium sp.]
MKTIKYITLVALTITIGFSAQITSNEVVMGLSKTIGDIQAIDQRLTTMEQKLNAENALNQRLTAMEQKVNAQTNQKDTDKNNQALTDQRIKILEQKLNAENALNQRLTAMEQKVNNHAAKPKPVAEMQADISKNDANAMIIKNYIQGNKALLPDNQKNTIK